MSSVVLGLPKRLQPQPEAALSPDCFSQMTRVFPNNVNTITSSVFTTATALGSYAPSGAFPVQEVRFSVPAGMGKNVFIDTSKSRLNFRIKVQNSVDTGATTGQGFKMFLESSAYSWFDRIQTLNQNGVAIDDVVGLAQIMTHKNNYEFDSAERDSMWQYGFRAEVDDTADFSGASSVNYLQGHAIYDQSGSKVPTTAKYFDYSVPLPSSLLGMGARNMCPIGSISALNLSLWTNNLIPVAYQIITTVLTTAAGFTFTMDNISVDLNYVYLDQKSASLLNMGREYYVHSITNRLSTGAIAAGTSGQVSSLIGLRGRSVRSLATRFTESALTVAGSINGVWDSKLVPATQMNYFLNGKDRVPNVVHNSISAPSTIFEHSLQAAEAFAPDKTKFGGTVGSFCNAFAGTSTTGLSEWANAAGTGTVPTSLSAFCFAEDLRVVSSSVILDGYNLSTSGSHYLELNIGNALTNGINISYISANDIIYVIDMVAGTVEARL